MSQYLGDISAYALAVSQGYTGTEEEYAELMASYATVGQTAVTAAQTATTKASEAATSATTATNKASEATTAATTATNKAAEAQADADAAALDASQALSAASTATTKATEATTAAATATSAKTDAVAANTAAQSAKTAAQTAQTGAETAAASVSASAEQIATNAEDISQLKSDLNRDTSFVFSADDEIQSMQYYVWKVENGVINRYANPSGYWKTLFAPVDCLYIDGTATMKSGGLAGNQSQAIPAFAFVDEKYNVVGTPIYSAIPAPHTFARSDVPSGAAYVVCQYALDFAFNFGSLNSKINSVNANTNNISNKLEELESETAVDRAENITLTWQAENGYINKNGSLATYSDVTSATLNVTPNEKYLYTGFNFYDAAIIVFYDSSDNVVSVIWEANNTNLNTNLPVTVPANAVKMKLQRVYGTDTSIGRVTGKQIKPVKSVLSEKRITLIGDSITEKNFTAMKNWADYLTGWTGAVVQNLGASGTGFIAGGSNPYSNRISRINTPDIIGVALSFNDMSNTIADLKAAAESFFDSLIAAYPSTPIICYVQSPWSAFHYGVENGDAWVDEMKEICNTRGIPFYDGLYMGGTLKPWLAGNRAIYYMNDGAGSTGAEDWVHPNSEGHKIIARYLYPKFVENLVAVGLDYLS